MLTELKTFDVSRQECEPNATNDNVLCDIFKRLSQGSKTNNLTTETKRRCTNIPPAGVPSCQRIFSSFHRCVSFFRSGESVGVLCNRNNLIAFSERKYIWSDSMRVESGLGWHKNNTDQVESKAARVLGADCLVLSGTRS